MTFAAIMIAIGVTATVALLTPSSAKGPAWISGIALLDLWIVATPSILSLRLKGKTDAGWLAGLGLYSVASATGQAGAVLGLFASLGKFDRLAYATYVLSACLALAMILLARQATARVEKISTSRAFKSQHTAWHERLELARSRSRDANLSRFLAHCSDLAMHAARDTSASGFPVNARIDAVVEKLCQATGADDPATQDLVHMFESLLMERSHAARSPSL